MMCLLQFYQQTKKELEPQQPLLKFLAIKLVVFLFYVQTVSQMPAMSSARQILKERLSLTAVLVHLQLPHEGKRTNQTHRDDILPLMGRWNPQHDSVLRDGGRVYLAHLCIPP